MAVPPGHGPGEGRRTYPHPGQPIPPPAPGPSSPLSAIFARALLFPMMGATVVWAFTLAVSAVAEARLPLGADLVQRTERSWDVPVVALAGCGLGLLVWVIGLATCWRRAVLWAWVVAGALVVAGGTVASLVLLLG